MDIDAVIAELINQKLTEVWFYPTQDSSGAKLFQILDDDGSELAWRWFSDGPKRWRIQTSSLKAHVVRPVGAVKHSLIDGAFQLGIIDAANGSAPPIRPAWCR